MTTVLVCALCGTTLDADADEQSGMAALSWVASHERGPPWWCAASVVYCDHHATRGRSSSGAENSPTIVASPSRSIAE